MKKFIKIFGLLTLGVALMNFATSCENTNNPDNPNQGETFEPNTIINELTSAVYTTEEETGIYNITIGTNLDRNELPAEIGDMYLSLYLYAPLDADPTNATLPSGTYNADSTHAHMTWDPLHTVAIVKVSEGQEMDYFPYPLSEGTIQVERDGDEYTLNVAFRLSGDTTQVRAQYVGPIVFATGGSSVTSTKNFEVDPKVSFDMSYGTYYGSYAYPFSDDVTVVFRKNIKDEDDNIIQSYTLNAMIYIPKLEDYNTDDPQIPSGTYDVSMKKTTDATNTPFTVSYGFLAEYMGQFIPFGSALSMTDYLEGQSYIGYFVDGSMEVTNNDGEYDIKFNFITPEGLTITGSYKGGIEMENRCNNDLDPNNPGANGQAISTLTEDVVLDIPENDEAVICHYGNYIFPDYAAWYFQLGLLDEKGDFIQTEFLKEIAPYAEAKNTLAGTYTVNTDYVAGTMLPGYSSFGNNQPFYTYYGDLDSYDEEQGYHTKMGCIIGGTMTIEEVEGLEPQVDGSDKGVYTFTFDLVDDAGNSITGTWTGNAYVFDLDQTIVLPEE